MYTLVAAACAALAAAKLGLRDTPINTGAQPFYLDGEGWTAYNADASIVVGASVPGDLLTDLQAAGIIGDPLYQMNFMPPVGSAPAPGAPYGLPLWDNQTWSYNTTFNLPFSPSSSAYSDVSLVFDGVKMAADVTLNGVFLGTVADMFWRYTFPVASVLKPSGNTLTLSFYQSNAAANNEGRWDSCSGGWDWAFYSGVSNPTNSNMRTFSKGIWRSVYVLPTPANGGVQLTHLVPLTYYQGAYPTAPMTGTSNGPWTVNVTAYLTVPVATSGTFAITGNWPGSGGTNSRAFSLAAGNTSVSLTLPASDVQLWWPNGMGDRTLYSVTATWTPAGGSGAPAVSESRSLAFRVLYLVTADDTTPAARAKAAGSEGSGNFTMRWKVNGADMYAKGGNIIPMEEMEGRISDDAYVQLVYSAVAAGFNTFRVWGGGIYAPASFYDAADALGVLMYHDAMYSSDGRIPPAQTPLEDVELRHNVRRLAHHPSIGHWDSCNECDPVGQPIYYTFVATVMSQEDPSRPIWPSCPSQGWATGVNTLTGLPNGNTLVPIGKKGEQVVEDGVRAPARPGGLALPDPRPDASLLTLDCGEGVTCTVQQDVDYDEGTFWVQTNTAGPSDCCASCASNSSCAVGVFFAGVCYWKKADPTPVYSPGRVAVWPPGSGPIPPAPPIYVTVEAHGPYQHGGGFPAVNGNKGDGTFGANIPINLAPAFTQYGPGAPGTFYSEFGASAWSSFESIAPTLEPISWGLGGGMAPNPEATCQGEFSGVCPGPNPIAQRNYPPHSFIATYFAPSSSNTAGIIASLNLTGTAAFQRQLYLAVLAQGLEMKADISTRRASPHTGTVFWQFNEIWPTGGWGSVEYGTVGHTPGQVLGGRWKTLQHYCQDILYKDVFITCGGDGRCFVRNDGPMQGVTGTAYVQVLRLTGTAGPTSAVASAPLSLGPGFGAVSQFCLGSGNITAGCAPLSTTLTANGCAANGTDCMLLTSVVRTDGTLLAGSWELLSTPGASAAAGVLRPAQLSVSVARSHNPDGSVDVTVTNLASQPGGGSYPALFVTLTTLAQGRFSTNAFILPGGAAGSPAVQGAWQPTSTVKLTFIPFPEGQPGVQADIATLTETVRVEHLGQYLP